MMFYAFDFLIIFVSFACHKHHIAILGQYSGCAYSVLAIGDFQCALFYALVVLAGGFLLARPSFVGEAIGAFAGAALIVYGASELLSSWKMNKVMKEYEFRQTEKLDEQPAEEEETVPTEVRDVEFEKVDEQ